MANKITVTSVGTTANVNATPDSARYYSDKSKEWAISDKKVNNEDYSSKYYAQKSKEQAQISTEKTEEVVNSGNEALSNIEAAKAGALTNIETNKTNAIMDIINQETLSVDNVNTAGEIQVNLAKEQATIATNKASEVVESGNTALSSIDTAKTGAITDITDLKNDSISSMENTKSETLTEIETLHTSSVDDITNLKNTSVSNITTAKNNAITSITTQETTSKNNIITTGNEQVERIHLAGIDNKLPMFTKGEKETNEGVYQNVYDMKHSTFDLSKFTVVGSPVISDDGVASNLSNTNKVVIPFDSTGKSNFRISFPFHIVGDIQLEGNLIWNDIDTLQIYKYNNGWNFKMLGSATGITSPYYNLANNVNYICNIEVNNNTDCKFTLVNEDTGEVYLTKTLISERTAEINQISISQITSMVIDLKQFSITVDGKEVFSGNKTGLDVIKPDNYEVVGSPTISEDGVASGFGRDNYLKVNSSSIIGKTNYTIECAFTFTNALSISEYDYIFADGSGAQYGISIYRLYNTLYARCNANNNKVALATNVILNTPYEIKINVVNGVCSIDIIVNNQTTTKTLDISTIQEWSDTIWLGNRFNDSISSMFIGSIDLNAFKIYVDGNLVYQPCLRIPYTLSKTGSKIVDVAYRDRVIDLYEQEGQAWYYTIDEPNKNFTLPMGEIYGMIGQRSLISSTVTETNRVDIYSDKTCLICGNVATAGTINLPIELVNNNYFITLSTGAKTATSFTTTATGDYILIGKVI